MCPRTNNMHVNPYQRLSIQKTRLAKAKLLANNTDPAVPLGDVKKQGEEMLHRDRTRFSFKKQDLQKV